MDVLYSMVRITKEEEGVMNTTRFKFCKLISFLELHA